MFDYDRYNVRSKERLVTIEFWPHKLNDRKILVPIIFSEISTFNIDFCLQNLVFLIQLIELEK